LGNGLSAVDGRLDDGLSVVDGVYVNGEEGEEVIGE